jgi:hypothetical protein
MQEVYLLKSKDYDKSLLINSLNDIYIDQEFSLAHAFCELAFFHEQLKVNLMDITKDFDDLKLESENILKEFDNSLHEKIKEALIIIKEQPNFSQEASASKLQKIEELSKANLELSSKIATTPSIIILP